MSQYEKLEHDVAKLTITVSPEAFKAALETAYHKYGGKYPVPGFRKGKAPRRIIESNYGPMVFYDAAFDLCWADPYEAAIKEHDLQPVDRPSVDITDIGEDKGIVYTAEVQLRPTVTLGQYKGIEIPRQAYTVTEEEVDMALRSEQEAQARYVDVERPVADKDRVLLDYAGTVDGVAFEGGTAQDQTLDIGSGTFIPGFEDQLIGAAAGEDREVKVTFPEKYHAADLAGKDAVFACKIKAVQQKELPEIDDEFIKDISEFDTVAQWKENKKAELLKQRAEAAKISEENELLTKAADNAQCDIPECMIERQVQGMIQDMAYRLAGSGISMDNYFKYMGTDMDKVKEMYKPEARMRCKVDLTLEAIKKAENITAAPEEVEKQIDLYATQNGMTKEDLEKNLSESDREYFADRACVEKVIRLLSDSAVRVDAPAEEKKDEEEQKEEKAE